MVSDLSLVHHSILGSPPPGPGDPHFARHALPDSDLEQFREQGYVRRVRVLDRERLESLQRELEVLMQPQHPGAGLWYERHGNESTDPDQVLFHALGAWRISRAFHDLLWEPAFLIPAFQLLGGPVRFWHDQLFCKPPRHGGVVAWHQDYAYWTRTEPLGHLSCFIALDDMDRDNGCLHYVPGSHHFGLLPRPVLAGSMDAIREVLTEAQRERFQPVPMELQAGEASFHHPLLIHGSHENRSPRPRRAAVINVFRDGTRSASLKPPLEGVPAIPAGQPMGGRFFPLLYPPC